MTSISLGFFIFRHIIGKDTYVPCRWLEEKIQNYKKAIKKKKINQALSPIVSTAS